MNDNLQCDPTPAYKHHRSNDPISAKDAAKELDSLGLEEFTYRHICDFGENGCNQDELLAHSNLNNNFNHWYNTLPPRFSKLLEQKRIFTDGSKRKSVKSGKWQRVAVADKER